jgi:DNA-directed RNA polymerase sigma subunit (sigma70/sigma32)
MTLKQTGHRIGRSAERARQIEEQALEALRRELLASLPKT